MHRKGYKEHITKKKPKAELNEKGKDQRFNNNPKGAGVKKGERAAEVEKYGTNKIKGTLRQRKACKLFLDMIKNKKGAPKTWREILDKAGYSDKTQPYHVRKAEPFQKLLDVMPDDEIVFKWLKWAMDDDTSTRGHALRAGENIMKLKSRSGFENKTVQVQKVQDKLGDIIEADYDEK